VAWRLLTWSPMKELELGIVVAAAPTPGHALVQLCPDAALVHERGVIILANAAAAGLAGARDPDELVGRDVATYLGSAPPQFGETLSEMRRHDEVRFPVWVRELPLPLAGRIRRTLLVRPLHAGVPTKRLAVRPPVQRALVTLEPRARQIASWTVALASDAFVSGDDQAIEQLTAILVLEALAGLDAQARDGNQLSVALVDRGVWVQLEVVAEGQGGVALPAGVESFGMILAHEHAARLGAELRVEAADAGRRSLRVTYATAR
jgi:hypothetical protein